MNLVLFFASMVVTLFWLIVLSDKQSRDFVFAGLVLLTVGWSHFYLLFSLLRWLRTAS